MNDVINLEREAEKPMNNTINPGLRICVGAMLLVFTMYAFSNEKTPYESQYIGQDTRVIKSLSPDDIQQLQNGGGWGLAKAAELNGMPGPKHVLDMQERISLTAEQEQSIRAVFDDMKAQAIPLGTRLIELERQLNDSFADRTITRESLIEQLDKIAVVRKELRYVHLAAHFTTSEILSSDQRAEYNRLRGYQDGDPCQHVPQGHNAEMWRKHNGCD